MKITLVSDLHIKSRTWQNYPALSGDAYKALLALDSQTEGDKDILICAGDLFDSSRPSADNCFSVKCVLGKWNKVFYIQGNHEMQPNASWFQGVLDNSCPLLPTVGEEVADKLVLLGYDYQRHEDVPDMLSSFRSTFEQEGPYNRYVCVIHQAVDCMFGIPGVYAVTLDQLREISKGYKVTWICGHVHKNKLVEESDGDFQFYSPGSLYPLSISEIDDFHGFTQMEAVYDNPGSAPRIVFHKKPISVRTYEKIVSSSPEEVLVKAESMYQKDKEEMQAGTKLVPYLRVVPAEGADPASLVVHPKHETLVHVIRDVVEIQTQMPASLLASTFTFADAVREECADDAGLSDISQFILASSDPVADIHKVTQALLGK